MFLKLSISKKLLLSVSIFFISFSGFNCTSVPAEDLYGKWNYVKIESSDKEDPDSVTHSELQLQRPSIEFTKPDSLKIFWGGKILSRGNFRMDNKMIRYTEILGENRVREFPFLIIEISPETLVFETMEAKNTRITAVKSN
ncbi:MAG: hypothetical protein ABI390_01395 [Daejeonella sp.]